MKRLLILSLISMVATSSGCGVFRSVEQWKCDRLGMCHFGTRPSAPAMMSAPMVVDPCCPNAPDIIYQP